MQSFNETDRPETPVSAEEIDPRETAGNKKRVDHPVVSENLLESERSDKRRKNHGNHRCKMRDALPGEFVCIVEKRHRERNQENHERCHSGNPEGIRESFQIDEVRKHLFD